MKAFTPYYEHEIPLRQLCDQLKNYGTCNCTFTQFVDIYNEWHKITFPGCPVNFKSATFRNDWFQSFFEFLINYEI